MVSVKTGVTGTTSAPPLTFLLALALAFFSLFDGGGGGNWPGGETNGFWLAAIAPRFNLSFSDSVVGDIGGGGKFTPACKVGGIIWGTDVCGIADTGMGEFSKFCKVLGLPCDCIPGNSTTGDIADFDLTGFLADFEPELFV